MAADNRRRRLTIISLWLALLTVSFTTQAAFITDKIIIEVFAQRFSQGAVLKKLSGGTSVEVLMADGNYTRIRTTDNITGWIDSKYISNEKPLQLEYLELLSKSKITETNLRDARQKLANVSQASSNISDEELEKLKQQAKDSRWIRVEMIKARDHAKKLEAQLKSENKQVSKSQAEFDSLRTQNTQLEQRLAAAMLISDQQEETDIIAPQTIASSMPISPSNNSDMNHDGNWTVKIEWFLGSIISAIIIGILLGISWLDKRIRKRHGGFRLY